MCGIAGVVNLTSRRSVPSSVLHRMADALFHRGPDEDGYLEQPGISLASRRLSIVGLADGRQPISNEDGSVSVVFNGELFDYPERRAQLEGRGHRFRTHCDTEVIPHLWEDHQEGMLEQLRGQFALALWDQRRRRLVVARDRFGICPLYWTRQTLDGEEWLLFASEIKGLLASGMVEARIEPRGIDHAFTFFGLPAAVTCFAGVYALLPGRYLQVQLDPPGPSGNSSYPCVANVKERTYWEIDFPDRGQEDRGDDPKRVVDGLEAVLLGAVERRLRADVPVVSYLSGGVDSTMVAALASHIRGQAIPSFTIRIPDPSLDETSEATLAARHIGADPVLVRCGQAEVLATYPRLIEAAEGPVIDTSCAAMLLLAQEVHAQGFKVALTGEGSDEWLAGYPWYKTHRVLGLLDIIPGLPVSRLVRRAYLRLTGAPRFPWSNTRRIRDAVAGDNPWLDLYGMVALSRWRFYSPALRESLGDYLPYDDLQLNVERTAPLAPAQPRPLPGRPCAFAGTIAQRQGRPRGHAQLRRDALPVPGRGGFRLPLQAPSALDAAPLDRQVCAAQTCRALAAKANRLAEQGHVPRSVRRISRRHAAGLRRSVAEPGEPAEDWVFRCQSRDVLAAGLPWLAGRLEPTHVHRNGPGGGAVHAALAQPFHRRQSRGFAIAVRQNKSAVPRAI